MPINAGFLILVNDKIRMFAEEPSSAHAFRKAEQSFDLLDYERSYLKNCVNGAFMPPQAMPLTQILRYETHIVVVLCSPERMHSLTVQYALIHRYLQTVPSSVVCLISSNIFIIVLIVFLSSVFS